MTTQHRSAWLDIDLAALRHNATLIRSLIGTAALAPVVKANAYGHGLTVTALALRDLVDAFCVATLGEALELREAVGGRVLLLYPTPASAAAEAIASGAELTIMSPDDLAPLQAAVPLQSRAPLRPPAPLQTVPAPGPRPVALHLSLETGLGRGGLTPPEAVTVAMAIRQDPRFILAGLWSHLASPEDPVSAGRQLSRFTATTELLQRSGIPLPPRHLAASGSLLSGSAPALEMVRPGLVIYGVLDPDVPVAPGVAAIASRLQPAMSLKARPVALGDVEVGGAVGYGGRWRATRPTRIAILPVGYADGYLRAAQPGATALVRGQRVPLVGVISMDALAVDVTDVAGVGLGDEFVLLGRQAGASITASDLARARNTIAWEVLTGMAARLDRVYYPSAGTPDPDEPPAPCQT